VGLAKLFAPTLHVVYSPEFLTERTAELDMQQSSRLIFGDYLPDRQELQDEVDHKAYNMALVQTLFGGRFPQVPQYWTKMETASLVKYCSNVFFANKISIFNEFAQVAEAYGVDPMELIGMVLLDQRIGRSHFQVPGHDGKKGYGGSCFPKDVNGYIHIAGDKGVHPKMAIAGWYKNLEVRPEKDWEQLKGRAVSEKE
jgi:UDP-glucose 6-dehydrogenase